MPVWAVLSILLLPLILILVIPLSFAIQVRRDGKNHFAASASWLGAALQVENTSGTLMAGPFALKKICFKRAGSINKHKKKALPKKADRSTKSFNNMQYLNTELITSFFKSLRQVWAALSVKVEGKAVFGFEDPALTGITYGFMSAASLSIRQPGLTLIPDFLEPGFAGYLSVQGRFTVGRLLFIAVKFLLSRPARHLWWPWPHRKEVASKWRKSTLPTT
jgi:hypothetical protein